MVKILITGSAGFIGFHLTNALLKLGLEVVGIDNINDYYSPKLKYDRLFEAGIDVDNAKSWYNEVISKKYINYRFIRMNLEDKNELMELCKNERFDMVINLAAQAGVRYSISNPESYLNSNIAGFLNIIEACRHTNINHLIYASSSSVYGLNHKMPFSEDDNVDHPISFYAATKKANELMAHTYSHLFKIETIGLRFFTVYGPWGRPDMAYFLFADAIRKGEPINVYNRGELNRDFTFIDDIVEGIVNIVSRTQFSNLNKLHLNESDLYKIYNIGNSKTVKLMDFISILAEVIGKKPELVMLDMQPGDVISTWANVNKLATDFNYKPNTDISEGLKAFGEWYRSYFKI